MLMISNRIVDSKFSFPVHSYLICSDATQWLNLEKSWQYDAHFISYLRQGTSW